MEVKREIDLLVFLRRHSFPCPHPLQDRKGRYYRDYQNKCLSLYKYTDGKLLTPERLGLNHLENIGRTLGDLHVVGKGYKKGIDNRFSFERIADLYLAYATACPTIFAKSAGPWTMRSNISIITSRENCPRA